MCTFDLEDWLLFYHKTGNDIFLRDIVFAFSSLHSAMLLDNVRAAGNKSACLEGLSSMHASFTIGPYRFHSIACCVWGGIGPFG